LRELGWQGQRILGSGRTDTGVHAAGQVIAFDLDWQHTSQALLAALNAQLPQDVTLISLEPAASDFHPRYDASYRTYRYRLYCHQLRLPLLERYAWRVWPEPDEELLHQAASMLAGEHDFAAFGKASKPGGSTLRNVLEARWSAIMLENRVPGWDFWVSANGFLYRMVRRLVDYQVSIGLGKRELVELKMLLQVPPAHPVQALAPAQGLVLHEVGYR
jgi:tRNA pseudouridine38-40 synthase